MFTFCYDFEVGFSDGCGLVVFGFVSWLGACFSVDWCVGFSVVVCLDYGSYLLGFCVGVC